METPFAGGRWSAAQYKRFVERALRRASIRWPPRRDTLEAARRPAQGRSARTKWEYLCASCGEWYLASEVQVDHIEECGSLDDMNRFIATLFCESDNLRVLCKPCHKTRRDDD